MLFDNSLNDKRVRIDIRTEDGYEEVCKGGARIYETILEFSGVVFLRSKFFVEVEGKLARLMPLLLLLCSNLFMVYAWYGHLKDLRGRPLLLVIVASWCVAFFEYCFQVPANRLGSQFFSLPQLKVIQEIIAMAVFAGFCAFYMKQKLTLDYLWATLCLAGAAFFLFRKIPGA